jgi:hypothetical protein
VIGVRGVPLRLADCPVPLRPLTGEFSAIGREAAHIEEEDTMEAIRLVQEGRDGEVAVPRLQRTRLLLERRAGNDVDGVNGGRRSAEGRAVAFVNRVNALTLWLCRGYRSSRRGRTRCSRCSLALGFHLEARC